LIVSKLEVWQEVFKLRLE